MFEVGTVESVNDKHGTAKVVFDRKSACAKCGMCLTANGDKMKVYVDVKNSLSAKVGDKVEVAMSDRFVLKAAFVVYLIPILLIGIGLAIFRNYSDIILFAVICSALIVGTGISIVVDRLVKKKGKSAPIMRNIILKADAACSENSEKSEENQIVEENKNDDIDN